MSKATSIAIIASASVAVFGAVSVYVAKRRKAKQPSVKEAAADAVQATMDKHPENEAVQTLGKEALDTLQTA
jgi:hypothetical protein